MARPPLKGRKGCTFIVDCAMMVAVAVLKGRGMEVLAEMVHPSSAGMRGGRIAYEMRVHCPSFPCYP